MINPKFFFIRHGQLVPPYLNHLKMDYETLADLSVGELDPGLNVNAPTIFEKQCSEVDFSNLAIVYYNSSGKSSRRSIESAQYICNFLKNKGIIVKMIGSSEIHEVDFNVRGLLSIERFREEGMQGIRTELYNAAVNGGACESIDSIGARIEVVQKKISEHFKKGESVLFVTHDFFMRFLEVYIKRENRLANITVADLEKTSLNYYFGGFKTDGEMRALNRWGGQV